MAAMSLQLRAIWWLSLYLVLFPVFFVTTVIELAPQEWRDGAVKSVAFVVLMTLGLACAAATGGRL